MSQTARPISDTIVEDWTGTPDTSDLYKNVDTESDTDYNSYTLGIGAILEHGLTALADPLSSANHVLTIRSKAADANATYVLSDSGGTIKSGSIVNNPSANTDEITLSGAEADSIVSYSTLKFKFTGSFTNSLYWVKFTCPTNARLRVQAS